MDITSWDSSDLQGQMAQSLRAGRMGASLGRGAVRKRPASSSSDRQVNKKPATAAAAANYAAEAAWTDLRLKPSGGSIRVGTECSGLESIMVALGQLGLSKRAVLMFACEKDVAARKIILAHQTPKCLYPDITTRPVTDMPEVDVYAAGFPCQPFSAAGLNHGVEDAQGRGLIFPHLLRYIRAKSPKVFLLENVKGLTTKTHEETFEAILAALRKDAKYVVSWRVLNTSDHGLPQNRPRLYIIGMRKDVMVAEAAFKWPRPCARQPLQEVLERSVQRDRPTEGTGAAKHVEDFHKVFQDDLRKDKKGECYILDCFATRSRVTRGVVPCLTRTRAGTGGYWVERPGGADAGGLLTTREMLRLQGLPEDFLAIALRAKVSERQLRQMIGNAMSINVLARLFHKLLPAVGLS